MISKVNVINNRGVYKRYSPFMYLYLILESFREYLLQPCSPITCLDLVHESVAELLGVVVADLRVALQRQQSLQYRVSGERRRPSVAAQ